jgi:hypothetical protein
MKYKMRHSSQIFFLYKVKTIIQLIFVWINEFLLGFGWRKVSRLKQVKNSKM